MALALGLAALMLPLETTSAEAGRIKVRVRSSHNPASKVGEQQTAKPGSPLRVRIRTSSGSGSSAADGRDDQKARPRAPSAAAAAAARARATLEAEKAAQAAKGVAPAAAAPQALPTAKTTDYGNGVTCIAGC
jgi:hypothetical protein